MIFHQVLFAFNVSALQRGQYHDFEDPIIFLEVKVISKSARRILKILRFILLTFYSI